MASFSPFACPSSGCHKKFAERIGEFFYDPDPDRTGRIIRVVAALLAGRTAAPQWLFLILHDS